MTANSFRYAQPATIDEALALMAEAGSMVLAGGQTLIPRLSSGLAAPSVLVDLGRVSGLKKIEVVDRDITVGSMVSLKQVIESAALLLDCPLLPQCAGKTATPSIRNRGTLVGNLAWADPASQLPVAAIALDAIFRIERAGAFRFVPADQFFQGPNLTVVANGEMVTHLHVKAFAARTGSSVADVALRQNSRALATAAAVVTMDDGGRVAHASLAVGGCGDVPRRCPRAEGALIGSRVADAPEIAAGTLRVDPPQKGGGVIDAAYAIAVLPVLLRNAVRDACSAAAMK